MKHGLFPRYWLCHKGRAFSILFAIAASMAALTSAAFLARSSSAAELESRLDVSGNYDIILTDLTEERIETYMGGR